MEAKNKTINSLLSFSKTAIATYGEIQKQNEIRAEEDRKIEEVSSFFSNPGGVAEESADTEARIQATDSAINGVATELESTGDIGDADAANTLRNEAPGWKFASYQGNAHAATAGFASYLAERQAASKPIRPMVRP